MTKVTPAPITSTAKGLSTEVPVGPENGLERQCVVGLDNVLTVPAANLGGKTGYLTSAQEAQLARAVFLAYDLDVPLLQQP